ncbi:MAG: pyridoxamine 5'-phosphate oxidase family protein [Clostridiales bacterium]|nr:pyridoxamine 5'-phosphate oxidase family protein [Clostridiales bacterium]
MNKQEIFGFCNDNPAFFLATAEGEEPRVRAMLLYKADEDGFVFHTGPFKEVYQQIMQNPHVQLCFYNPQQNLQIRVRGKLEMTNDRALKEEIANHPTRVFMQGWRAACATEEDFYNMFSVFRLKGGLANVWTFESNFKPKEDTAL